MKPEAMLLSQIKTYLYATGFYFHRINTGLIKNEKDRFYRSATRGTPDVVCCIHGRFVAIEAKSSTGKQSIWQQQDEEWLKRNEGEYWLIRSLDELIEKVKILKSSYKDW